MPRVIFNVMSVPIFPESSIAMTSLAAAAAPAPSLAPDATVQDLTDACAAAGIDPSALLSDALTQLGFELAPDSAADAAPADPAAPPAVAAHRLTAEQLQLCKDNNIDPKVFARAKAQGGAAFVAAKGGAR